MKKAEHFTVRLSLANVSLFHYPMSYLIIAIVIYLILKEENDPIFRDFFGGDQEDEN